MKDGCGALSTSRLLDSNGPLRTSRPFHVNSFNLTLTEEARRELWGPDIRPGRVRALGMASACFGWVE